MARAASDDDDVAKGATTRPRRRRIRQDRSDSESSDSEQPQSRGESPQLTLLCTTDSVKLLVTLLSCLASPGRKDQRIRCDIDCHGILFTTQSKGKSLQIKTSVASELFESYEFVAVDGTGGENEYEDDDDILQLSFALNLNTLIECLSIFGPSALPTTSLRMSYDPERAHLLLVVEDNGVICECSMQVLEHDGNDMGQLEFESAFEHSAVVGRCIIQSEPLHDAFAELYDLPSAASVTIAMFGDDARARTKSHKCLSLSATSETGSCEIEFGATSKAFIEFFCAAADEDDDSGECAATFHVAVLQQAFKALASSNETFLRMNADGFLSVQHMIESGTGEKAFVDALISPEDTSM
uniref:Cell cycle checkpoint protein RAD1 n=1 Tax=Globisporangium ultimum (strain ATCC 200006 / CBS 805.95 / DAOM BR144) TaxID=431595 RepID=K3X494_GLOUD